MYIERKRWELLGWGFPFNHRRMRPGETLTHVSSPSRVSFFDYPYIWQITLKENGMVEYSHTLPNHPVSLEYIPITTTFTDSIGRIPDFGPGDATKLPWRLVNEPKRRKR